MSKITLNNIGTLEDNSSLAKLNENFQTIIDEFDNVLSLDGDNPSAMTADLDMNSNQILNLPDAVNAQEPATLSQLQEVIAGQTVGVDANVYDNRASVLLANIDSSVNAIRTLGYSSVGDGGGALYKRVITEPSHAGKIQSADGAWWELAETTVNVKMFGAVGDGSTDDTTAIQNALGAGVNVVYFPGTSNYYRITAAITPLSGQTLFGDGETSEIRQVTASSNVIHATNRSYITIRGLHIYGAPTMTAYISTNGVLLQGCSYCVVEDCLFEQIQGGGVNLFNSNDCLVKGNRFINSRAVDGSDNSENLADIAVVFSSNRNVVANNHCVSGSPTAILLQSIAASDTCNNNIVIGNIVENCKSYGIIVYAVDSSGAVAEGNTIVGNTVKNITGTVISALTGNNDFGAGIYLQSAEGASVVGNTIQGTHTGTVTHTELLAPGSIGVANCSNFSIIGNYIEDAGMAGIYLNDGNNLSETSAGGIVSGNVVRNSDLGGIRCFDIGRISITDNFVDTVPNGSGIRVDNSSTLKDSITISGNTVRNITGLGSIQVAYAEDLVVSHNVIDTASIHGITIGNSTHVLVSGNAVRNHVVRGIQIETGCVDVSVKGNSVKGTGSSSEGYRFSSITDYADNRVVGCTTQYSHTYAPWATLTVDSTTPSIQDGHHFTTANTVATTITNFTNGKDLQEIWVRFSDANTTLNFTSSNLKGNGGVDRAMAAGDVIHAVYHASLSVWFVTIVDIS